MPARMRKRPPGYDEPLDSPMIDDDPPFREVLRLLNERGVHTVSSCQGHAPGTQYENVQEWMDPYITCEVSAEALENAAKILRSIGGDVTPSAGDGKVHARFQRGWDWTQSVAALRRESIG